MGRVPKIQDNMLPSYSSWAQFPRCHFKNVIPEFLDLTSLTQRMSRFRCVNLIRAVISEIGYRPIFRIVENHPNSDHSWIKDIDGSRLIVIAKLNQETSYFSSCHSKAR